MGISCFPVSVQLGTNSNNTEDNRSFEIDLLGEVAGRIIDFAQALNRRSKKRLSVQDRIALAGHPEADEKTLLWLAVDEQAAVRSEVVFNPATPCAVLRRLTNDSDKFIAAQARAQLSMKCAA